MNLHPAQYARTQTRAIVTNARRVTAAPAIAIPFPALVAAVTLFVFTLGVILL